MRPLLSTDECLEAIELHSRGLAEAARADPAAQVRHCPGWDVAELVWHVANVHWFWSRVVEELPRERPAHLMDDSVRPARPQEPAELVELLEAGAARLVEVLRDADQPAPCWTWAPQQQDVAFVTRHQVQEAAVHHWDAGHAVGRAVTIAPEVAADAVEEFLTFSVSSAADPADPPRPALDGALWFCGCVSESPHAWSWLVTDGPTPGTLAWQRLDGADAEAVVPPGTAMVGGHGDPADLLLWLYGRLPRPFVDDGTGDSALLERVRALTFTD